jgi:hypothetical protein
MIQGKRDLNPKGRIQVVIVIGLLSLLILGIRETNRTDSFENRLRERAVSGKGTDIMVGQDFYKTKPNLP